MGKHRRFNDSDLVFVIGTLGAAAGPGLILGYDPDRKLYRVRLRKSGARIMVPDKCLQLI